MTKWLFRAFLTAAVLFVLLVVLNRLDRPKGPDGYTERDLPPASLEPANGAFWLLFLGEPESEGLDIQKKLDTYRRWLSRLDRVERLSWQIPPKTKPLGVRYWQMISGLAFPGPPERDWPGFVRAERGRLKALSSELDVLLGRYERLIGSGELADFGYKLEWDRPYALLSFVQATARLYSALRVLEADEGRPGRAAEELIAELHLGERLAAAGQSVFFYNLGRSIVDIALDSLAGLMNLESCPQAVFSTVAGALPALTGERFSSRAGLIGEFLWARGRVDRGDRWLQSELALRELLPGRGGDQTRIALNIVLGRELGPANYMRLREAAFELFLMKNRTLDYFRRSLEWLLELDSSPPFRWERLERTPPSFKGLNFWWLWNPAGKLLYESLDLVWQRRTVERKYLTRALYDMVRISAEMHIAGQDRDALESRPEGLEPFAALDPFSGRSYRWDAGKRVLWSAGIDRKDDRGNPEADFVLPVR